MFKTILVGIDGTPDTSAALRLAADLAHQCKAGLHVVCAVDRAYFLARAVEGSITPEDVADYPAALTESQEADRLVHRAAAPLRAEGLTVMGTVLSGDPAASIAAQARTLAADLIVLGHQHMSWYRKLGDRSVCRELLEIAPCPVLVVPATR